MRFDSSLSRFRAGLACGLLVAVMARPVVAQSASASWPRGDLLSVAVEAEAEFEDGLVTVGYEVHNAGMSLQAARAFAVRSDLALAQGDVTSPDHWDPVVGFIRDSSAVSWWTLEAQDRIQPGREVEGFEYRAAGLLDFVGYRVQGYYQMPAVSPATEGQVAPAPSFWGNSATGVTLGVVAFPADASPAGLVRWLGQRLSSLCLQGLIAGDGICRSLQAKLDAAGRALVRGNLQAAKGTLQALEHELEAQHEEDDDHGAGKHVGDAAYTLLSVNIEVILARL